MEKIITPVIVSTIFLAFGIVLAQEDVCTTCIEEDPAMCPPECFWADEGPICGDGFCDAIEVETCPEDCEATTTTTALGQTVTTTTSLEEGTTTTLGETTTTISKQPFKISPRIKTILTLIIGIVACVSGGILIYAALR